MIFFVASCDFLASCDFSFATNMAHSFTASSSKFRWCSTSQWQLVRNEQSFVRGKWQRKYKVSVSVFVFFCFFEDWFWSLKSVNTLISSVATKTTKLKKTSKTRNNGAPLGYTRGQVRLTASGTINKTRLAKSQIQKNVQILWLNLEFCKIETLYVCVCVCNTLISISIYY